MAHVGRYYCRRVYRIYWASPKCSYVSNIQECWSQQFNANIPFFSSIFKRERFLQIFWMLHLHENDPKYQTLRARTQKVSHYLDYLDKQFKGYPSRDISVDESIFGFKDIKTKDLLQKIKRKANMPRYIVDGFVFHVNITKGNPPMIYLRCLEYKRLGCHARAVIPYDGSVQDIKVNKPHNHPPDFAAEEKIVLMRELKEVMLKNPTVPSRTVYATLSEMYPNAAREISFDSIRHKMNRWRRQQD